MNLTILSLSSAKSASLSPFLAPDGFVSLSKSLFKQHFSPILYSQKSFSIQKTTFSQTLNSAIVLDNGYSSKNKLFKSTENMKNENDYTIISCDFYQCSSSGSGGAINFKNAQDTASVTIQKTGFYQCSADSAACFDASVKSFTFTDCCVYECRASSKTSAFAIKSSVSTINEIYLEKVEGPYALNIDVSTLEFCLVNSSSNKDTTGSFLQLKADKVGNFNYLTFDNNIILNTLFYINCKDGNAQYFNFYKNFPKYTIELGNGINFFDCYFIEERSKIIINTNSHNCRVQGSYFSGTKDEITTYFPSISGLLDIIPGASSTATFKLKPSAECWVMIPFVDGGGSSNNITYKIFFGLAIAVLILAMIFFYCRFSRRRYGLSTDKLAYTL